VQYSLAASRTALNELAATAYRFIALQEQVPSDHRSLALQRAQAAEAEQWQATPPHRRSPDTPRSRRLRLAQFLVRHVVPSLPEIEPESFERRHIRTGRQYVDREDRAPAVTSLEQHLIAEGVNLSYALC
jgi:hypothetical protein